MLTEHLRYLTVIEDLGSIRKAGRQLNLNPQNLSYIVKAAEREYGTQIFERSASGMKPTEDGRYILSKIRASLTLYDESHFSFMYPSHGVDTSIAQKIEVYIMKIIDSNVLMEAFDQVQNCFPNITLELKTEPEETVWQTIAEKTGALGAVYRFDNKGMPAVENVEAIPLFSFHVALYASPNNVEAQHMQSISFQQAAKLNYVVLAPYGIQSTTTYELLNRFGKLNIRYAVDNPAIMESLLKKGNYYCIAGHDTTRNKSLIEIPFEETDETSMTAYLLCNTKDKEAPPLSSVVEIIKSSMKIPK